MILKTIITAGKNVNKQCKQKIITAEYLKKPSKKILSLSSNVLVPLPALQKNFKKVLHHLFYKMSESKKKTKKIYICDS